MFKKIRATAVRLALTLSAAASLMAFATLPSAQAALLHTLEISDPISKDVTGSGFIEFNAPFSVMNPSARVVGFSLSGSGPLGDFSFGLDNVELASWSIDPMNWELTLFGLSLTNFLDPDSGTGTCLASELLGCNRRNDNGDFGRVLAVQTMPTLGQISTNGVRETRVLTIASAPVEVDEPATLGLFGLGLVGLGLMRRRRAA